MIKSIGIDAGSTAVKIVGIGEEKNIVFYKVEDTLPNTEAQITKMVKALEEKHQFSIRDISVIATGYGRNLVDFSSRKVTEITCHVKGIFEYFKVPGTLIDIGGQDSKVALIGDDGNLIDFIMNDKCAAGTGRFLENTAWRLKIPIEEFGKLALKTSDEVSISSTCAVFAESEVISLLAKGEVLEKVIRGLHRALVRRIVGMAYNVGISSNLLLSGGVVKNLAIQKMIEEETGTKPLIPQNPQIIGAYGAAILGLENI